MPSIFTHYTFAKKFIDLYNFKNEFYLGAQGPDVFYFYGYVTKRKDALKIREFGTFLHQNNIADIYNFMLEYASNYGGANKEMLLNYIYGLFNHYVLDRNTHPYIFYKSGFSLDQSEKKKYFYNHALFESRLDHLISKRFDTFINPIKFLKISKNNLKTISRMYYVLTLNYLKNLDIKEDTFLLAYKDMINALKCLHSNTGFKNFIFKCFFKNSIIYAMSTPHKIKENLDYLNIKNEEWKYPSTGDISSLSFLELIDNASNEYSSLLKLLDENNNILKELEIFVNEINHDGNKIGLDKKYFKLIW